MELFCATAITHPIKIFSENNQWHQLATHGKWFIPPQPILLLLHKLILVFSSLAVTTSEQWLKLKLRYNNHTVWNMITRLITCNERAQHKYDTTIRSLAEMISTSHNKVVKLLLCHSSQ